MVHIVIIGIEELVANFLRKSVTYLEGLNGRILDLFLLLYGHFLSQIYLFLYIHTETFRLRFKNRLQLSLLVLMGSVQGVLPLKLILL